MSAIHHRPARLAALLLAASGAALAQQAQPAAQAPASATASAMATSSSSTHVSTRDQRRAAKLFLQAGRLFQKSDFEAALQQYEQAAELDPGKPEYGLAAKVARSHVVTALIQAATKARFSGDSAAARAALQRALQLDPGNAQLAERLNQQADDAISGRTESVYEQGAATLGSAPDLVANADTHNFHLRTNARQLILNVYKAYGIDATVDQSIAPVPVRFDLDSATYQQASQALGLVTHSFAVPLDAHRVLVARDTPQNRDQYTRQDMETIYLPGLSTKEMTDVSDLAKTVFQTRQAVLEQSKGTMTIRASTDTLDAFNTTLRQLLDGRSQVLLDVRLIQLAHTNQRSTGAILPQQLTAFNVYAEEQAILNSNQQLVQQIISSGLAAPGDTLAILGILLASGQVSSSIFSNGIALFGGGLTLSGLSPGPASANLSLNASDSRALDDIQLRIGDGEDGTLRSGLRYPITTSSYSDLGSSNINIPGLTSAGTSSSLLSLLSSLTSSAMQIPQVEYQDLGLTLKATPKVVRNGDVALTLDLKLTALAGTQINGLPVLNNRAYSAVVTLREGSAVVVASELNQQESRAISGMPGLTEIPGLNDLTGRQVERDYATLLIIITPHVIRGPQAAGHSPMLRIDRAR